MARELELIVEAQTAQAEQNLARVDKALDGVEASAAKAAQSIDKTEKAVSATAKHLPDLNTRLEAMKGKLGDLGRANEDLAKKQDTVVRGHSDFAMKLQQYAGPAVIIAATKKTLDFADSIKTLSDRTGASPKFIQQAGFAAEKAGSTFEGLATAMQTLDNNLVKSNKAAVQSLDRMGVSLDDLLSMDPEDRFVAIARAVSEIEDPAERSAAAMSLMGRSGKDLIPLLEDIAKGAHETSFVMSNEMIGALAEMKQQLDSLMQFGKTFLGYFLGWPAMLGKWADDVAQAVRRGFSNATNAAAEWMMGGLDRPPLPNAPNNVGAFTGNQGPLTFMGRPVQGGGLPPGSSVPGSGLPPTSGGGGTGGGSFIDPLMASWLQRAAWNQYAAGAYGPMSVGIPGVGPGSFPGWAFTGGGFEGSIPGMFPGAMMPVNNAIGAFQGVGFAPTVTPALGGGGNAWTNANNFLSGGGAWGALAGAGLGAAGGMLGSYLAGNQTQAGATGSGVGSTAGSIAGGMIGGPLGSWVGGVAGGWLGGRIGEWAGAGPEGQVNDARDAFFMQFGDERSAQVENLNREVTALGLSLDRLYEADDMHEFNAAILEINNAFEQQEADAQRLTAAMQKYNISIQDMGAEFTQGEINKGAAELMEDFRVLVAASGDFNMVAGKMAPTVSSFINTAMEMGSTVPREMEPMIAKMIEMGVLTDKNGAKFTDLSQIPFSESLTASLDRVADRLNELINELIAAGHEGANAFGALRRGAEDYGDAVENIPDVPVPDYGGGRDPDYVHTGGMVGRGRVLYFDRGGFVPRGTDTVPAMLTPGEMVLSRGMVKELARAGAAGGGRINLSIGNLQVSGSYGSRGDAVEEVGSAVVEYLERRGVRLVA